jgi:thiamine kinase-like enzyme
MATRPTLPYFAPADTLPAPLPSVASILACKRFFQNFQKGCKVIRFNEHYVVKYGPNVYLQEGENMLFVRQATTIRVPTVYALFHDKKTGSNFIVQEYIKGQTVYSQWEKSDRAEKDAIVAQLRRYLDELRSLPSPGYFGGIWEQRMLEFLLIGGMDASKKGLDEHRPLPCVTEKEWVDIMLAKGNEAHSFEDRPYFLAYIRRAFHTIFQGHRPVFTHSDLAPSNMLICQDGTIVLIDWGRAGWYPCYWEYCLMMSCEDHENDWGLAIPQFLDEYIAELGWLMKFREWVIISCM